MRNATSPGAIAFIVSVTAAIVSSIGVAIFSEKILPTVINFCIVLLLCYFIFYLILNRFIYDKIKTIYRNIYQFKTNQDIDLLDKYKNESDPLEAVSKDVLEWIEKNRKEVNDLKELEKYIGEFLGNVSHELKTPIQSIQGYIHTLLDGALEDESVNQLFLIKASNSTKRLIELVDELTNINVLQGKNPPLEFVEFDIIKLTNEVFEILENKAVSQKIELKYKHQNPKQVYVYADQVKIRQVLINLVVNAIKYGKNGGVVEIGFYDMDENILIEVSDNGQGIAEEHLPRLFERFYRTDKGRSRDEGGNGLGLAIVKYIIEAHNQIINVRSSVGIGSTFGFTLKKK
ncbi:HAMP domain-containing histidine kinase [Bacteroidia bacterium]|nr:HAMP domain-containing histidine kinase [Bacteroidia bacterium]